VPHTFGTESNRYICEESKIVVPDRNIEPAVATTPGIPDISIPHESDSITLLPSMLILPYFESIFIYRQDSKHRIKIRIIKICIYRVTIHLDAACYLHRCARKRFAIFDLLLGPILDNQFV
jgi:hypothetical protein